MDRFSTNLLPGTSSGEGNGTYTLENLLPLDVIEPCVEVLDAVADGLELVLVGALDFVRLADDEVEGQADTAIGAAGRQPAAAAGGRGRCEAELVVARLGGREVELAGGGTLLSEDAVVIVEDFL